MNGSMCELMAEVQDANARHLPAEHVVQQGIVPPTTHRAEKLVRQLEERVLAVPQVPIATHHVIHAGVYSRTIMMPKDTVLTSALIKIPTTLVICGDCSVLVGNTDEVRVTGYRVLAASAGRKQAYIAHEDTFITMSFKTKARTVEEAEAEFTDEHERLMSRHGINDILITGE